MSLRVYYEVLNQKGSPALFTDTFANRPAFGFQGRLFISTDTGQIFEDTGTAWTLVADAGVGGGTLSSVCLNGNTTATGIVITAGGLSSTTGTFSGIVTTPQVKASTSAGLSINANSGTQVADFGAGGSANITLFGGLSGTSASFSSSVTGNTIVKSGGTASQYLMADGSVTTLTNPVTGTGTTNTLPKFTGSSAIGNSNITDTGTEIALNSDTAIGTTTLVAATKLTLGGTETAVSNISRGQLINTTLVASANSDFLVALDINPTFTNGAFTGVQNFGLRVSSITSLGSLAFGLIDNALITIKNFTSSRTITINPQGNSISSNDGLALGFTSNFSIAASSVTLARMFSSGNLLIQNGGTYTDAGFRLDVQGTARVTGAATYSSSITAASLLITTSPGLVIQPNTITDQGYLQVVNTSGSIFFGMDNSAGSVLGNGAYSRFIYNTGAYPLDFYTNALPRTRITSGGSLLVGTTTDNGQGALQVTGGITANDISLTGANYSSSATITRNYYSIFTGGSGETLTLPTPLSNNYQYVIINNTANTVTLAAATSCNIVTTTGTNVASITLIANQRVFVIADGNNKYYQIF